MKTSAWRQWRRSDVFIANFDHISHLFLVSLLLHLNKLMLAGLLFHSPLCAFSFHLYSILWVFYQNLTCSFNFNTTLSILTIFWIYTLSPFRNNRPANIEYKTTDYSFFPNLLWHVSCWYVNSEEPKSVSLISKFFVYSVRYLNNISYSE